MIIDLPPQQPVIAWHQIVETCLQNDNLTADVRVSSDSVDIVPPSNLLEEATAFATDKKQPSFVSKETTLNNVEQSLQVYFATAVNQLADQANITDPASAFAQQAQSSLTSLVQEVENDKKTLTESTSQIIQKIDRDALKSLFFLKATYAQPALNIFSDPTNSKSVSNSSDITPLPKTLILSGGGMKGVGYIGAYRAMEESGVLQQLNLVGGTSVGASTAAFIAAGMTSDMLQQFSDITNYERLLDGHSSSCQPSSDFDDNEGLFDGTYAMNHINQGILNPITLFFNNISLDDLQAQIDALKENGSLTAAQEILILQLRNNILGPTPTPTNDNIDNDTTPQQTLSPTTRPIITFQDLDALHALNPSQFKSLTVTAFDETQGQEIYLNVQTHPSMTIAEAVRASMSVPGLFEPIKDDQGDLLEDGGIGSNTPSEISNDPSTTFVCFFHPEGELSPLATWCAKELSGNENLSQDEAKDIQKIAAAGNNAFAIYYGTLNSTSFSASQQDIHTAELQAEVRMWEQLLARQN